MSTPCPNHDGNYDCTPFCPICEGEQEVMPARPTCDVQGESSTWEAHYYATEDHPLQHCYFCERAQVA